MSEPIIVLGWDGLDLDRLDADEREKG